MFTVKEIFYTLQGEGAHTGRAAVFCRFAGCNLWSGRESDRNLAICQFCDTDFVGTNGVGGGKYESEEQLALAVSQVWNQGFGGTEAVRRFVVFTGGEPMLQLTAELVDWLHQFGFEVAIETNGTLPVLKEIDWICVSPKQGAPLVQTTGHELKVVVPQLGQNLAALAQLDFNHFFVQAKDVSDPVIKQNNLHYATQICLRYPKWRLSVQTHKIIGLP